MSSSERQSIADSWARVRAQVANSGINMSAALDCAALSGFDSSESVPDRGRLLLFAAGGRQFWHHLVSTDSAGVPDALQAQTHAVDEFSRATVMRALNEHLSNFECRLLYPGATRISLTMLGEQLGWSHQSPLGLGINSDHGLWFAYRALVWSDASIPLESTDFQRPSPCTSCESKDCVAACPVDAVSLDRPFNLTDCASFRLRPESICADRCHARLACPVAADGRQSLEQHRYHQMRSLQGIRRWLNSD